MEPGFYEVSYRRANASSAFLNINDYVKKTHHQFHPDFGISQMLFWMKMEPLHLPHFPQQMHFRHPTHTKNLNYYLYSTTRLNFPHILTVTIWLSSLCTASQTGGISTAFLSD